MSGLSFSEMMFGSGKRNAPHGAFVGQSRLVSDQIDSGNLQDAPRDRLSVATGPGQTCPFSAKHAWAPTEQRSGWGNWNPLTIIITSRHVDIV